MSVEEVMQAAGSRTEHGLPDYQEAQRQTEGDGQAHLPWQGESPVLRGTMRKINR